MPLDKRAPADGLIQDVKNIDAGVKVLAAHTTAYQGGPYPTTLYQGSTILVDALAIHLANRKGYADALIAPKLSAVDSQRILTTVAATVVIDIPASIQVLKSKKAAFQKSGLVPAIVAGLKLLLNDHDTFSAALLQKLTLDPIGTIAANAGVALIHTSIQNGIDYYSM